MNLLEKKKANLERFVTELTPTFRLTPSTASTELQLYMLRKRAQHLAAIVHEGQVDAAGKPYIQHPMRVAAKATNLVDFCIRILHDVVEDGKELGITLDFLRDVLQFPEIIVDGVDAISRREGETYAQYVIKRLTLDWQACKAKLDDNIDNSNVVRFDNPSVSDLMRCKMYLERAQYLKSTPDFQVAQKYDFVLDIVAMHKVAPLACGNTARESDGKKITQKFYFAYEEADSHSYSIDFNADIDPETGKVMAVVQTYPSKEKFASYHIWLPRRQVLEFKDAVEFGDYLHNFCIHLNASGILRLSGMPYAIDNPPDYIRGQEERFVRALTNFHA